MGGPPTCVFSLLFLFFPSLVSLSPRCHGQASPAGDLPGRRRHGNQPIRLSSARSAWFRATGALPTSSDPAMPELQPATPDYTRGTSLLDRGYNHGHFLLQPTSLGATTCIGFCYKQSRRDDGRRDFCYNRYWFLLLLATFFATSVTADDTA